jgi:S1-C subfamily serine protease
MTDEDPRDQVPGQEPLFPPPWPTARPAEPAPPWPSAAVSAPPRAARARRTPMVVALVAVVALLAGAAGAAVGVVVSQQTSTSPSTSSFVPPGFDGSSGGPSSNGGSLGDRFGSGDGSGSSGSNAAVDVDGIASRVNPAIVNIATTLSGGQEAAGTGMVLTASGEVLTNNHVINGATRIQVEVGITGKTYSANVLGYDVADDVALIKLDNASGMKTISTATASSVSRNDAVVAIGNALGQFGTPSAVAGTVTALHQQVTAGDGLDQETLSDMIRIAASIQPGDSGGALVNDRGKVIGMNTAADAGSGRFGFQSGTTGFAIPIDNAIKIVDEIKHGDTSNGAHIGDRALLGVVLEGAASNGGPGNGGDGSGAAVADVGSDTPAEGAGIEAGATIVGIGKHSIGSIDDLRSELDRYRPGDKVAVAWVDASGGSHHATVTLAKGPPA